MTRHRLTWLAGRATPVVTAVGSKRRKTAGDKVVASRLARKDEERKISKGQWVTTRPPGKAGMRSRVRPALGRKQKRRKPD